MERTSEDAELGKINDAREPTTAWELKGTGVKERAEKVHSRNGPPSK